MELPEPRHLGVLLRRYKRFLADIRLPDGREITAHCPNSGSMLGCSTPGSPALISWSGGPKRQYPWTLEMVQENTTWIGVNTGLTNHLVNEGLRTGIIDDFGTVKEIRPEVRVSPRSRLDFRLETGVGTVFLEVKNCSLAEKGIAMFPDAVTSRGRKHLEELASLCNQGHHCAMLFCVQRADACRFAPAADIDPAYAAALDQASRQGVRILVYQAEVRPEAIRVTGKLPFTLQSPLHHACRF